MEYIIVNAEISQMYSHIANLNVLINVNYTEASETFNRRYTLFTQIVNILFNKKADFSLPHTHTCMHTHALSIK